MPNQHTNGPGPIALQHRDAVLQMLASGLRLSDIAPKLGVTPDAISKVLKDDPDYRSAIESSFDRRLDKAEDDIQDASEQVDVSRARAYHEVLRWRAGVECNKFAPKQQITQLTVNVNADVSFADSLASRARTFDGQSVAHTPIAAPLQQSASDDEQIE